MRLDIKNIVTKNKLVILIILLAVILRLYKLPEFTMFLSDQGRDAIIIKDIITLRHWPAIGAPSSVGMVYLGPFYYYLMAPFLLLFLFNPVGLAYGAAVLSIIGIIVSYIITKKEFGNPTALLFLIFIAFSYINIGQSRFSWNPNLLPFFSFLTLYFFYRLVKTNKIIYAILLGSFLSFSIQLHYLAIFLVIPMILVAFSQLALNRFLISLFSFLFFSFPLVIFDFRHDFLNSRNLITLFTQGGLVSQSSLSSRFSDAIQSFFSSVFTIPVSPFASITLLILLPVVYFLIRKKMVNLWLKLNLLNIMIFLLAFSFINTIRLPHYYGPIYLSFFLVVVYLFTNLKLNKIFLTLLVFLYLAINVPHYYFLYQTGENQINHSKTVADFLANQINKQPFNIATWPVQFTEDNYIYFLELKGLMPADRKKMEVTNQMFVLCNQEPCEIINSPSWNISMFGPAKIDKIWNVDGIRIYKLIHTK